MRVIQRAVAVGLALGLPLAPAGLASGEPAPTPQVEADRAYRMLARTINMELAAEDADHWGDAVLDVHLDACRNAGFTAVRLPVSWQRYVTAGPPYTIAPAAFARVDRLVEMITERGLAVIVDYHKDKAFVADPAAHRERFLAIVDQVASHYRDAPPGVVLEPFAEPNSKLDGVWNEYFAAALALVRKTNPRRPVLVGPPGYNSVAGLPYLRLPPDPGLIVCVHLYQPVSFVFQGEDFFPGSARFRGKTWTGGEPEREALSHEVDEAVAWARANRRPMFIEEFGCTDNADMASRIRWTRSMRSLLESRGLAWGIWSFGPSFAIYDLDHQAWKPGLLEALIPAPLATPRPR